MKLVKKLTALFLAIVMTMAMGITSFAATSGNVSKDAKVSITIANPVKGHTYKVYQVLTGDVADLTPTADNKNGSQGTLSNAELGTNIASKYTTVDAVIAALKTTDPATGKEIWLSDGALSTAAYDLIDTDSTPVASLKLDDDAGEGATLVASELAPGYYVIVDAYDENLKGDNVVYSRNMVTVIGDTTVKIKSETPSLDKNIIDNKDKNDESKSDPNKALDYVDGKGGKTDTAAIGDEIQFEITGSVPNMDGYDYYHYIISDTLSEGLTLVDDYDAEDPAKVGGFTVTIGGKTLTRGTHYDVYTTNKADGTTTFKLAMHDLKSMKIDEVAVEKEQAISVKYNAIVNEKAKVNEEANTNTASLIYSNDPNQSGKPGEDDTPDNPKTPTGETPDKTTKTYVTQLKLTKVTNKNGQLVWDNSLKGAEFTLTGEHLNKIVFTTGNAFVKANASEFKETDTKYYLLKEGGYTSEAPTTGENGNEDSYASTTQLYKMVTVLEKSGETAADYNVTAVVDSTGVITFKGLNVGSYKLEETKVPAGYNKADIISFEIKATEQNHKDKEDVGGNIEWTVGSEESPVSYDENNKTFKVEIENKPGSLLPSTGGMGTTVIYIAGIAMIVAAGIVVIARKRFA